MVRRRLAAGLQHACEVLHRCLEISSGEVAPDTGLLLAVTGETGERIGIDSGLYAALQPLYVAATAGGQTIQVTPGQAFCAQARGELVGRTAWQPPARTAAGGATGEASRCSPAARAARRPSPHPTPPLCSAQEAYRHLGFAHLHLDVYRRQRRLPHRPWFLMITMARGLLNAAMMCGERCLGGQGGCGVGGRFHVGAHCDSTATGAGPAHRPPALFPALPPAVYPMQTGKQRATLIARHRKPLLALAAALTDCCNALGDVFVQNRDIGWARCAGSRAGH